MTTDKPEVVAWLHSTRQESEVITDKVRNVWGTPLGSMGQYTVPLIRLSDYEALQAERDKLHKYIQMMIDQTTPLVPDPDYPGWSRRIQLDEVMAERDSLRTECEKLAELLELMVTTHEEGGWPTATITIARAALAAYHKQGDES